MTSRTMRIRPALHRDEAVRDGDEWVINGHKWFTSNGIEANFFIVMCRPTIRRANSVPRGG